MMSSRSCGGWGTPACLPTLVSQYHGSPLSEGPLPPTSQGGNISKCGRRLRPRGMTPSPFQGTTPSPTAEAWPLQAQPGSQSRVLGGFMTRPCTVSPLGSTSISIDIFSSFTFLSYTLQVFFRQWQSQIRNKRPCLHNRDKFTDIESRRVVVKAGGGRGGKDWGSEMGRCRLLYTG